MLSAVLLTALFASLPQDADSARLNWVPNPRTTYGGWVADPAGHLRPDTRARLDSIIGALERETTSEIAVVVIDSLDGLEPHPAALLLHRRWGVGKQGRNNGLLVLWSPALRKTWVSVGNGLEGRITDSRAGRVQDELLLPHFRRGEFDEGMLRTVAALATMARNETFAFPATPGTRVLTREDGASPWAVLGGIVTLVLLGFAGFKALPRLARRFSPRRPPAECPRGHGRMTLLTELTEDPHLSHEQRVEERIRSINYDVWVCGQCDARVIRETVGKHFERCPHCARRTLDTERIPLRAATEAAEGEDEVRTFCRNCKHEMTRTETTPKRTPPPPPGSGDGTRQRTSRGSGWSFGGGSGRSGGSSFGGGGSGGGGAGRSY